MLSAILKSTIAIEISIQIMDAFVQMRALLTSHSQLIHRLDHMEQKLTSFELEAKEKFDAFFSALEDKKPLKTQGIFYDGQIFDAYAFISQLIKSAKKPLFFSTTILTRQYLHSYQNPAKKLKSIF